MTLLDKAEPTVEYVNSVVITSDDKDGLVFSFGLQNWVPEDTEVVATIGMSRDSAIKLLKRLKEELDERS